MAADVHVRLTRWLLHSAAPAACGWRFLLPFSLVLLVCFVWLWLPKLLVIVLSRLSKRYVRKSSTGTSRVVVNSDGERTASVLIGEPMVTWWVGAEASGLFTAIVYRA
jgi:hypothetical protein